MPFTLEKLEQLVKEELPEFIAVCDDDRGEAILLTQDTFGDSDREVVLLAAAIKYAGRKKKTVTIVPSGTVLPSGSVATAEEQT